MQNLNSNSFSSFIGVDVGRVCQSARNLAQNLVNKKLYCQIAVSEVLPPDPRSF